MKARKRVRHRAAGLSRLGRWVLIGVGLAAMGLPPTATAATGDDAQAPGRIMAQQAVKKQEMWITADHSRHEILKKKFTSGPEVTRACLSCHNQAALQVHDTIHWTWMDPITEKSAKLGKGGLSVNNF
jgi:hypothetical protein